MILKRKLRENMKKKMIISTCFVLALFIGFLLGKCNSYVMNTSCKGSYEILDDGVIHFTSGNFKDSIAVSKKKFMNDTTFTLYDSSRENKLELVKFK